MVRRSNTIPQDPKSKEAQDERDSVVGDKERAQNEMLEIAKIKKQLLKDIEDAKITLDKQTKNKLATATAEVASLQGTVKKLQKDVLDEKKSLNTLTEVNVELTAKNAQLLKENITGSKTKATLEKEVSALKGEKGILSKDLGYLVSEIKKTTTTQEKLRQDVSSLEVRSKTLQKEIEDKNTSIAEIAKKLTKDEENKVRSQKELDVLTLSVKEKNADLATLEIELVDVRKKMADAEIKKAADEADISEKSKNLSLLEQRVDAKIAIFKQYKEKFTVDELAKMKINTDLS